MNDEYGTGSRFFKSRSFAELISRIRNWLIHVCGMATTIGHGIGDGGITSKKRTYRRCNDSYAISNYDDLRLYYTLNRLETSAYGIYAP